MALLPSYSEKPDFLMLPSGVLENVDHVPNGSGFKQLSPFPLNTHPPTHILLKWQQFSTTTKNYNSFFFFPSCFLHVSTGHGKTDKGTAQSSERSLKHPAS